MDTFYSNCHGAPLNVDEEICPKCGEHCGIDIICRKCKGEGQVEQFLYERPGMPFGGTVKVNEIIMCDRCDGFGFIELNL